MANSGYAPSASLDETAAAAMSQPPIPAVTAAPTVVPEYEDVLRQARLQAAEILQEAANEAESAVSFAREDGFEHGRQEGMAAAQAEVDFLRKDAQTELEKARIQADSIRRTAEAAAQSAAAQAESQAQALLAQARDEAAQLLEAVRQEQNRRLDAAQGALIELAVAATQRLVQGHLALQPEAVVAMMAAGLRRLKDCNCSVRVSPQDLPLLEAQRSTLERELATGFLQLQPDPGLSPGNYIINSPQGQIDGRLEKQTGVLRSALTNALGGSAT
ncbi:MAG TPA: FliH/SctL family protein [Symbiobacteriaceae bacterium]|jgi:flagellar assembly protein FliH